MATGCSIQQPHRVELAALLCTNYNGARDLKLNSAAADHIRAPQRCCDGECFKHDKETSLFHLRNVTSCRACRALPPMGMCNAERAQSAHPLQFSSESRGMCIAGTLKVTGRCSPVESSMQVRTTVTRCANRPEYNSHHTSISTPPRIIQHGRRTNFPGTRATLQTRREEHVHRPAELILPSTWPHASARPSGA